MWYNMAMNYSLQIENGQPYLAWSFFNPDQPELLTYYYRLRCDGPVNPTKQGQVLVAISYNRVRDEDGHLWQLDLAAEQTEATPVFVKSKPVPAPRSTTVRWYNGKWQYFHATRGWATSRMDT